MRYKLIPDTKGTGNSAAMVQLGSVEEATKAIAELSGKEHLGQMIYLSYVEAPKGNAPYGSEVPSEPRSWSGGGGGSRPLILKVKFAGEDAQGDNLFVGGLPSPTVDQ